MFLEQQTLFPILWIFWWLCTVNGGIYEIIVILFEEHFFEIGPQFLDSLSETGEPQPILTFERLCLSEILLYSVMLLTCWQLIKFVSSSICFWFALIMFQPFVAPAFLRYIIPIKVKMSQNFHEMVNCLCFNIWYFLYVLLRIKYGLMRLANHCTLFLYIF